MRFVHAETAGGVVLLFAALLALVWANSPGADVYTRLWQTELAIGTDDYRLTETLLHWINDGLMAIFFLAIGLEIKRELVAGELASPRRAALPAAAAIIVGLAGWGVLSRSAGARPRSDSRDGSSP